MFVVLVNIAARNSVSLVDNVKNLDKILERIAKEVFKVEPKYLTTEIYYLPIFLGRLNDRICKGLSPESEILDLFSLLVLSAEDTSSSFVNCVYTAWEDIKDRKGKMIDGIFVKESDLS
jgi:hypothetical protein